MAERALETAAAYVGAAVLFGIGVWFFMGPVAGQEFFAGYLLEQSLSIDNLFVFILVFKYFKYVGWGLFVGDVCGGCLRDPWVLMWLICCGFACAPLCNLIPTMCDLHPLSHTHTPLTGPLLIPNALCCFGASSPLRCCV